MRKYIQLTFISFSLLFGCAGIYAEQQAKERQNFINSRPDLSESHKQGVLQGRIMIGMDGPTVIASSKKPYNINETVGRYGNTQQWVFKYLYVGLRTTYWRTYAYVYFEQDEYGVYRVTSITRLR